MKLFVALYSQRAIRYFKPDPVPDDLLRRVLEAAIRAVSGGPSISPLSRLVVFDKKDQNPGNRALISSTCAIDGPTIIGTLPPLILM